MSPLPPVFYPSWGTTVIVIYIRHFVSVGILKFFRNRVKLLHSLLISNWNAEKEGKKEDKFDLGARQIKYFNILNIIKSLIPFEYPS